MKKTLIALAVLAASGATFAQATITGNFTFGYAQTSGGGNPTTAGIGTDTAAVQFNASEDLGGGLKAEAKVSIANAARGSAVTGEDAFVSLTGGFGKLSMGQVESANGLLAIGSSGASGYGLDGKVLSANSNLDFVGYGVPLSSALTLGVTYTDRGSAGGNTGLGVGSTGAVNGDLQNSLTVGVTYNGGPLAAKLDFTNFARQNEVASFVNKNRYRLSAGYDFGAARVSAGYSNLSADVAAVATTDTETLVGIKVPVGAVTFGLDYGQRTRTGAQDVNGYSLGVAYNLSKRTSVSTSYASWKQFAAGNAAAAAVEAQSGFRVFMSHSF